jgi:hypothetical protein
LIAVHNSMCAHSRDVRFWHKADMAIALNDVRFWGQSGHRGHAADARRGAAEAANIAKLLELVQRD